MRFFPKLALLVLLAPAAALAKDRIIECDFPETASGGGGWTAGPVAFHIEDESKTATVNSGVINYFVGTPIKAQVKKDLPAHIALSWNVKAKDNANQYTTMAYRLSVLDGGARATLSARPLSFDDFYTNQGTCKDAK
jgi:hypothetical protein